jgi:hypothetical protein
LEFAQEQLDLLRTDGGVRQQWETLELLERGPDRVALPLRSELSLWSEADEWLHFVQLSVNSHEVGVP